MTSTTYHQLLLPTHKRLLRNSIWLAIGHFFGLGLALWGMWKLQDAEVLAGLLLFLAFAFGNALRFQISEIRKLMWLIAVDRINANLFRNSRA